MREIILASKSPRRKELLENIGVKFQILVSDVDESVVSKDYEPGLYVRELALLKAMGVAKHCPKNMFVIGADTVVVLEDEILGKPKDRQDAYDMLMKLSGKTHYVYTGISLVDTNDAHTVAAYESTAVTFKELSEKEINYYLDNYNVLDKAGSYAIQEYAGRFVKNINGDYFNIVGLPVCRLCTLVSEEYGEDLI